MLINEQLSIYRVKLTLPYKLNHINCYAIQGNDGWCLIDTGLNTEESRKAWLQFMHDHRISGSDVKGIYITHAHPDHIGAAGWLQQLSGAPVFISAVDAEEMTRVWQGSGQKVTERVSELLISNGMPPDLIGKVTQDIGQTAYYTQPHPVLSMIEPGTLVQLGDFQYTAVFTPGHSDGHMCYFNQRYGILFSGDHLLAKITSNISLWPDGEPDPLQNYLKSLNSIRSLPCRSVLPAHGALFANMQLRISELEDHHYQRLKLLKECASGGATVYKICRQAFGQELDPGELRFAMTETLAHLMYLVYRRELIVLERDGIKLFSEPLDKGNSLQKGF